MAVKLFKFDGRNASAWVRNANKFFSFERIRLQWRVPLAACYLEGEALFWFKKAKSSDFEAWEEFVEALQAKFSQEWQQQQRENVQELRMDSLEAKLEQLMGMVTALGRETVWRSQEVGKEEVRVQQWGKTVALAYHGQQVGRQQEEIKSRLNENVETQEKFKKGAEKCDQTNQEVKDTDKLDQEKEETENKMMQETNPVEGNQHLFDQMIQPSQKELSLSESIEVKVIPNSICSTKFLKKFRPFTTKFLKFQHNGKTYHDEDYVFDKMLESEIVLMRDMCWDYEWWVFKIGWKQKTVQQAEIESWSSFVFQYSKEDDVHVVFLKHRWRWKKRMWTGMEGAQLSSFGLHLGLELHCVFWQLSFNCTQQPVDIGR
ncbi:uncharacterized protein LOC132177068 [Corylus avellana]|uniref:uncharacterized protein LOC132177068 n=1 Tax=Corylus avellana TaxID=13451 RepID=UPI001E2071E8|nr:uncharacterized protein LOC132177068 [Corylus avellana]